VEPQLTHPLLFTLLFNCIAHHPVAAAAAAAGGCAQNGGLQKIADDISKSVKTNCGKKAIVLSHSYGANVMAALFQKPEFTEWR
jgi:hypothetical protein